MNIDILYVACIRKKYKILSLILTDYSQNDGSSEGLSITVDCTNNIYVTGQFDTTIIFGEYELNPLPNAIFNLFIAKANTNGDWVWAITADTGTNGTTIGNAITVDYENNVYITGYFANVLVIGPSRVQSNGQDTLFIAKANTNGIWQWVSATKTSSIGSSVGNGITVDSQKNVYVTGSITGTSVFGIYPISTAIPSTDSVFVARASSSGEWLSAITVTSTDNNYNSIGRSIALDCRGNVYVTGLFIEDVQFGTGNNISSTVSSIFIAKLSSVINGITGTLQDNVSVGSSVLVCFPSTTIFDYYTNLTPGRYYYIGCNCEVTCCCKCPDRFLGVALTDTTMLTKNKCYNL